MMFASCARRCSLFTSRRKVSPSLSLTSQRLHCSVTPPSPLSSNPTLWPRGRILWMGEGRGAWPRSRVIDGCRRNITTTTAASTNVGNSSNGSSDGNEGVEILIDRSRLNNLGDAVPYSVQGDGDNAATMSEDKNDNSPPLTKLLQQIIKYRGAMTVASFMRQALQNPEHGYYMQRDVFGTDRRTGRVRGKRTIYDKED
eukprot:TRINITY_DN14971_c0_g1_i3.p1 TRINITY_DN14971_c0_g1~~TRINITY_DN14971_c0_g1_i3.p1  ORF type:complete len:199 (+),score=30.82 TRINITY_DN14971_c0_g1_i3:158-754(+)